MSNNLKYSDRNRAAAEALSKRTFTEEEKTRFLQKAEAGIAFGGGTVTDQMQQDALDIMEHRKTAEQVLDDINQRYTK